MQTYVTVYTGTKFYLRILLIISCHLSYKTRQTEPQRAKDNVFFTGDEVYELNENIPSTFQYGYYNANVYCSSFNESAWTPTHVRLGIQRALRSLSLRNLACVKLDARCKVKHCFCL
jgi:hypothetical protein